MPTDEERAQILSMIDSGQITAEEGLRLLKALEGFAELGDEITEAAGEVVPAEAQPSTVDQAEAGVSVPAPAQTAWQETPPASEAGVFEQPQPQLIEQAEPESGPAQADARLKKWKNWWWIPLWIGVGITVLGGILMYLAWAANGLGFWFACAWFPFLLGVFILALAWGSRSVPWLHVRVHQKKGDWPRNIAISFPLPLRLTAWFVRAFGDRIPHMDKVNGLDQMIIALEKVTPEQPFFVEVDEGDEKVEVYIG